MKYIITESKFNQVIKAYIERTYGDIEMVVDDDRGDEVIHFFSEQRDEDGFRKRIAYMNIYKTLWVNYDLLNTASSIFGSDTSSSFKKYFEDKFGIEVDRIHIEF